MNTRSMIFTIYGDYIRHYGNQIWVGSLIRLLNEFGHNDQAVRAAVSRMSKQGWLQSEKQGNKSYYSLSSKGVKRIDEAGNRIFKLNPDLWDGKWRMLLYSIPEEKRSLRDELRKELVWNGFGTLSNSLWISPNQLEDQVYELIAKYNIEDYVDFFISEYDGPYENHRIVQKSWDMSQINDKYDQFIRHYSQQFVVDKNKMKHEQMTDAQCFVERTKLVHEYRKFLFIDPGLPTELLPAKWYGSHAAALFADYYKLLAAPANRFFEHIFQKGSNIVHKDESYNMYNHPLIQEEKKR
ncbi:phenylacetic acid degradation operon negative regulatory protein PaaX [Pontibacillus litoralis]|uniref:PaaX family transcrtiptional regulator n=1 Tax=Pontibacillus litoralis JSM 072002 TaxID=1385512 RepID=A0A0A5G4A1_9BACI|nr:phenylacetic acid degradation operon negative regulatory protein PaaX [Pontibacillus litoralis]KGX86884.1 PaaX family transcrtiptional regulator [Pontibacillus litoralis JSM 072002]